MSAGPERVPGGTVGRGFRCLYSIAMADETTAKRKRRLVLLALAGVPLAGAGLGAYLVSSPTGNVPEGGRPDGLLWPQLRALPAVELVTHHGEPFVTDDFRDAWSLVFFGYASCPHICPTTLGHLSQVHRRVQGDPRFSSLQTVFVSVDPERDSPQRLREFVGQFNEDFIGLTGESGQLRVLTRALGAAYVTEEPDASGDYLIHHSSAVFLVGPGAELAAVLTAPYDPANLAGRLREMFEVMQVRA